MSGVKQVCSLAVWDHVFCGQLFDAYTYVVWTRLFERVINPNYICSEIALCDDIYFERAY